MNDAKIITFRVTAKKCRVIITTRRHKTIKKMNMTINSDIWMKLISSKSRVQRCYLFSS